MLAVQQLRRRMRFIGVALSYFVLSIAAVASAGASQAAGTRAPVLEDIRYLETIEELALSPDGRWAAYVVSRRFEVDANTHGEIGILDLTRGRMWNVEVGARPSALQWSPGKRPLLAFLAAIGGRNSVLEYSPLDSGSVPRRIVISDSLGGELLAFAWSPNGDSIAYVATESDGKAEATILQPPVPRLVLFRDSAGYYTGPTSSLYSIDSTGAYVGMGQVGDVRSRVVARHLVSAKGYPSISWSQAGTLLIGGAALGVSWQPRIISGIAYTIDPASGAVSRVEPEDRSRKRPTWSPSGRRIASLRFEFLPNGQLPLSRYTLEVESTVEFERAVAFDGETDGLAYAFPPMWGRDDRTLYVARYEQATPRLFVVDLASGKWQALTPDTLAISRYAISRDGSVLLGVLENANQPQEIFRIEPVTGNLTRLTHNADRLAFLRLGHVDRVAWRSEDARFTVHGFLVTPPSYDPSRRYPLIVLLHGGPGHLFTNSFIGINFTPYQLPPQLLASAGYMVLLPNPRGDPSYGKDFEIALHGRWASGPFGDIAAGVDTLIAQGMVDSSRVGIAGASYGGYLAAYAITQTSRFAAASIDDAPVDLTSEYGQNYATRASWSQAAFAGTPWTKGKLYDSQSPITFVSRVRTPVIMRYGGRSDTHDHIRQSYMLAQGFELYAALRDTGVPVEFLIHPDQGHGITDWCLYRDWVTRNLAWFAFWVLHQGSKPQPTPLSCVYGPG